MAIEMPPVSRHPNRLPFRGVLTLVDTPSDRPPSGARDHRVLLTRQAAERALASLLGMALDYTPALDAHDAKRKVGIITSAEVIELSVASCQLAGRRSDNRQLTTGNCIAVSGYIFAKDFPEVVRELRWNPARLGMSYELSDATVQDVNARIWTLTDVTFTGAAILRRDKAAYSQTWIELESSVGAGLRSAHSDPARRLDWSGTRPHV